LLREHPELDARDVVFLCEYHHDGEDAVAEIEAAGYSVHHLFSRALTIRAAIADIGSGGLPMRSRAARCTTSKDVAREHW
jgi:hypothetical protein